MPPEQASAGGASAAASVSLLTRVARVLWIATLGAITLFCLLLLAVRFVVFPRIDDYRDELIALLSQQVKQPVEIDGLATGWDGWNPKIIVRGLRVKSGVAAAAPLIELPEVDLVVAWTSLPLLDLRLKRLALDRPRLAVRRDRAGLLHVAGVEFDPNDMSDDAPLTDWVLRQPHIVVHDALITWNDDLRNAPQLVLDHVQFRLESRFGRHRFGLVGTPPPELAAPIDVRGDVRGIALSDRVHAAGKLYVRLDYADIAAWNEWLPLPARVTSGKGAVRLWFDLVAGEPKSIVADLELAGVSTKLAPDLPELELAHLAGRAGWRVEPPRREFYTRGLAFVTAAGQQFEPTDLSVTLRDAAANSAASGLLEFDHLQLGPLRELVVHLPLPARVRTGFAEFAPRGRLAHGRIAWEGSAEAPAVYSAAADFADLGITARNDDPGARGLTGRVEMTQATGDLKLTSRNAALELPHVFKEPIALASFDGSLNWTRTAERTAIVIERLEFANADMAGSAAGKYRTRPTGPGEIDVTAQLTRANGAQVHRYLPVAVEPAVRDWLRQSLRNGRSSELKMKLAGNLAEFPFAGVRNGQFSVTAKVRDAMLEYARGWPAVSEVDADLAITGTRMTIDSTHGKIAGVAFGKVRAEVDDLRAEHPTLTIAGNVAAPTADFLRVVDGSPIAERIDSITRGAQASGNGRLDLRFSLPLGNPAATKVAGTYEFINNDVRLVGAPLVTGVNGNLTFSEGGVRAPELTGEVLGGAARLAIANVGKETRITGSGTASVAALKREYDPPYAEAVAGNLEWTLAVAIQGEISTWSVESNLKGVAIDLPAPLGKSGSDAVALKVERRGTPARPTEDALTVSYGRIGKLLLHRLLSPEGASVDRALLLLGNAAESNPTERQDRPDRTGIWVRGELPVLAVDDWLAVKRPAGTSEGADTRLRVNGIDLDVAVLEAFGRRFNAMHVGARRSQDDWRLDLRGKELAGSATWSAPSTDAPNGRLSARLSRLMAPDAAELPPWKSGSSDGLFKVEAGAANPWPAIDLAADSYFVRTRDVGRLEFVAHPRGTEWKIDRLTLANEGGRGRAEGQWQSAGKDQQTKLDIDLDVTDSGKFLARFGFGDAVQHAPAKMKGQLMWAGAPHDFDFPTLSGSFRLDVGAGRFTKIDPGMGKLLGVLSLQALPRRATLDFTDVFSEGFAFDDIDGDVRIQNGVLNTDNMLLSGPAAKVRISGSADLAHETQQLLVRVQPALSSSVSTGAMLVLLANPVIGAAVAAGSLLAQKVLRDPIEQMFSYEYVVSGFWSDPVVTRKNAVAANTATEPSRK